MTLTAPPAFAQDDPDSTRAPSSTQATTPNITCAKTTGESSREVPWAQQMLSVKRAWSLSTGSGVTVAVIDSGVDASVAALAGRVGPGASLIPPTSVPGGAVATKDCSGHGTFLASIVAAAETPGRGFAGLAPSASVAPIQVVEPENGRTKPDLAGGLRAAVDAGAAVALIGSTMEYPNTGAMAEAVEYAQARDVLVVTPGMTGQPIGREPWPVLLAVGSIGRNGAPVAESGDGSLIDVVAPGSEITALGVGGGELTASSGEIGAAFVAGAAALVRAGNPKMTAQEVKQRIVATATLPGNTRPDPAFGAGLVDPVAAVDSITAGRRAAEPAAVAPVELRRKPGPDLAARDRATTLATVAALILLVTVLTGVTIRSGRQRGWRSARRPATRR